MRIQRQNHMASANAALAAGAEPDFERSAEVLTDKVLEQVVGGEPSLGDPSEPTQSKQQA